MRPIVASSSPAAAARSSDVAGSAYQAEQRARAAAEAVQSQRAGHERGREEQRDRWGPGGRSGSLRSEKPRALTNNLVGLIALTQPVASTGRSDEQALEKLSHYEPLHESGSDVAHEQLVQPEAPELEGRDTEVPSPTRTTKPPAQRVPRPVAGAISGDSVDVRAVQVLHPHAPEAATDLFDMPVPPVDPVMSFDPDIGPGRRDRGRGVLLLFAVFLVLVSAMSAIVLLSLDQPAATEEANPTDISKPQAER